MRLNLIESTDANDRLATKANQRVRSIIRDIYSCNTVELLDGPIQISSSNYFLQQQTLQHNLRCAEDEIEKLDCYIEEMREVRHVFTSHLTSRSSKL